MTQEQQPVPPAMPVTGEERPHRPADDKEEVYYEGSPVIRGELGHLFGWGVAGIVLIAAGIGVQMGWGNWLIMLILLVLGLAALVVPFILVRTVRYRITNYRIDFERGILTKRIDTLELWHVEDLSFSQSLFERMLGVGKVKVISHDETTPDLLIHGLPDPLPIFKSLQQRVIAVKRQRGVIKMDIG